MKRENVDHILRAAGGVTGRDHFVLIGSAAVVAYCVTVPPEMAISRDVDLFAYDAPDVNDVADLLEGALGHDSQFDATFGYYCDGVGPETAALPDDWQTRGIEYGKGSKTTNGVAALVPEPNDIALSKVCAWLRVAAEHLIIDVEAMRSRLDRMPKNAPDKAVLSERLDRLLRPRPQP